jgi:serine protease
VSGTIAAVSNNAVGVTGVAFGAKVQLVRVLAKCGGTLADIADAITWASGGTVAGVPANPTPAKVINMSLGGSGVCGATYQNAINGAVARGTTVVVAAGNSNANASSYQPSSCTNTVVVAASDRQGNRASYSNYGSIVDVTAPGGETAVAADGIASTLNNGTTTPTTPAYVYYQGTSMATPHVVGLAALVLSKHAGYTPAQLESVLKAGTRPLAGSCTGGCGTGLVDAAKTIASVP